MKGVLMAQRNNIWVAYLGEPRVQAQVAEIARRLEAQDYAIAPYTPSGELQISQLIEAAVRKFARDVRAGKISVDKLKAYDVMYAEYPHSLPRQTKGGGEHRQKGLYVSEAVLDAMDSAAEHIAGMPGSPTIRKGAAPLRKKIIAYSLAYASE